MRLAILVGHWTMLFCPLSATAAVQPFLISGTARSSEILRETLERSHALFAGTFGATPARIEVTTTDSCLSTGYDFETSRIAFCPTSSTRDGGIHSPDVVAHEAFHALLCNRFPAACTAEALHDESVVALHEGLADYFAFTLAPDPLFGEDMFLDRPFIRKYQTTLCYSLTSGTHLKGNTVAAWFISNSVSWTAIAAVLSNERSFDLSAFPFSRLPCFSTQGPELQIEAVGLAASRLHRYRLPKGRPTTIAFHPNQAFLEKFGTSATVVWKGSGNRASVFSVRQSGPWSWEVLPQSEEGWGKYTIEISSGGNLVGLKHLYFSQKD